MRIDIDSLDYDELVELNHRIVQRLKFLDSVHTHQKMMEFSPGDKVCFDPPNRGTQFGTIAKYNKKTVTIIADTGQKWNVSPHLLRKVENAKNHKDQQGNVVDFKRKQ